MCDNRLKIACVTLRNVTVAELLQLQREPDLPQEDIQMLVTTAHGRIWSYLENAPSTPAVSKLLFYCLSLCWLLSFISIFFDSYSIWRLIESIRWAAKNGTITGCLKDFCVYRNTSKSLYNWKTSLKMPVQFFNIRRSIFRTSRPRQKS